MIPWLQTILADPFWFPAILAGVLFGLLMGMVAYTVFYERKVSGWIQERCGPNRAGPFGLLQPIAAGVKAMLKEDIIPAAADGPLFVLAPALTLVVAGIGFAVIPWGGEVHWPWMPAGETMAVQVASIDVGLLYLLAVGSLGVYGIVLGGWASNNKFAMYGAMRSAAQMISYEIPMGLAILIVVLTSGELRLERIVDAERSLTKQGQREAIDHRPDPSYRSGKGVQLFQSPAISSLDAFSSYVIQIRTRPAATRSTRSGDAGEGKGSLRSRRNRMRAPAVANMPSVNPVRSRG